MSMPERFARLGLHLYAISLPDVDGERTFYHHADSVVVKEGALMLAVEVPPIEDDDAKGIEMPPAAIFAPGHWYSAILVDRDTHKPMFGEDKPWLDEAEEE